MADYDYGDYGPGFSGELTSDPSYDFTYGAPGITGEEGQPFYSIPAYPGKYSNDGYGETLTSEQRSRFDQVLNMTGSTDLARLAISSGAPDFLKYLGGMAKNLIGSKAGMAGIGALLGASQKGKPSGGGTTERFAGPMQMNRTMAQGKYGPVAQYNPQPPVRAAYGGMMQGYAQGGPVQMEDGGFVMTKKAVDGAGGPRGIQGLVPGAAMLRGPGTGTSDSMPAVINGPRGQTPALVSNGEAYVPKQAVQNAGGSEALYALMKQLQRRG